MRLYRLVYRSIKRTIARLASSEKHRQAILELLKTFVCLPNRAGHNKESLRRFGRVVECGGLENRWA